MNFSRSVKCFDLVDVAKYDLFLPLESIWQQVRNEPWAETLHNTGGSDRVKEDRRGMIGLRDIRRNERVKKEI